MLTRIRIAATAKGYTLLKYLNHTLVTEHTSRPPKSHFFPLPSTPTDLETKTLPLL